MPQCHIEYLQFSKYVCKPVSLVDQGHVRRTLNFVHHHERPAHTAQSGCERDSLCFIMSSISTEHVKFPRIE